MPLQPGIATEVFRKCLTDPFARAFIDFAQSAPRQKALCETFYGHPVNRRVELDSALTSRIYGRPTKDEDLSFPDWEWYLMRPDLDERWSRLIAGGE